MWFLVLRCEWPKEAYGVINTSVHINWFLHQSNDLWRRWVRRWLGTEACGCFNSGLHCRPQLHCYLVVPWFWHLITRIQVWLHKSGLDEVILSCLALCPLSVTMPRLTSCQLSSSSSSNLRAPLQTDVLRPSTVHTKKLYFSSQKVSKHTKYANLKEMYSKWRTIIQDIHYPEILIR